MARTGLNRDRRRSAMYQRRMLFTLSTMAAALLLAGCADKLVIASHARLTTLDPVTSTAYVTRSHGYMVYDTLFALDEDLRQRPQMAEKWTSSSDLKTWQIQLRDGLQWHDGKPVTAQDCVASLQRWGKRDGAGQQLFRNIKSISVDDDQRFTIVLNEPDVNIIRTLAKVSVNVPFMMPKRLAETDAFTPVTDAIGSGPFIYKPQRASADKVVYVRNPNYKPRHDPQSLAAGAKVANFDVVEWRYYPSQREAVEQLIAGKVDYVESPSTNLASLMEGNADITVASTDPLGNVAMARFNHQQAPFNNPGVRRAVLMAMQQDAYMSAALGDARYWRNCYSVFPCGTPLANEAGSEVMQRGDLQAARQALKDAGYDGAPVVVLNPTDTPVMAAFTKVTVELLQELGMTVQVRDMDWATLLEQRERRVPVAEGGWSMFHTWWNAADLVDTSAIAISGDPQTGWFGWAEDAELERLRAAASRASGADKVELAARIQQRLWDIGAFGVLGQFFEPVAFRSDLQGITSPMQFYWGVSRGEE
ncbi:ABC transporter substrate-binding protein [Stutzerimonas stutzeri]|uniref:ABC transporter substrate-binding protein n=1 Tax=Stutzerimonas stutzeri TaxID=316 RepID=UPI0018AB1508|nr:ABC transporter substrate-binding protein [Stutzerimonas stutzeri]QPI09982.1 ABC transporter substrate-binding protein [Stutzerimonas stutzeri]